VLRCPERRVRTAAFMVRRVAVDDMVLEIVPADLFCYVAVSISISTGYNIHSILESSNKSARSCRPDRQCRGVRKGNRRSRSRMNESESWWPNGSGTIARMLRGARVTVRNVQSAEGAPRYEKRCAPTHLPVFLLFLKWVAACSHFFVHGCSTRSAAT
jgi:hypothetical protein